MEDWFIDPFSGENIQPTTPYSAGPSRYYESGPATSLAPSAKGEGQNLLSKYGSQPGTGVPVQKIKAFPSTIWMPPGEDIGQGLLSESLNQFHSTVAAPQSATPSQNSEAPPAFKYHYITTSNKSTHVMNQKSSRSATSPVSSQEAVPDTFSDDITAALKLQAALDTEDAELRRQFQYALSLQEIWQNEDVQLRQQEEFAKETLRAEEERAARIQADFMAAEEAQSLWEEEEEAARIAEVENMDMIEREQRERAAAEAAEIIRQKEIETRNRQIQEEKVRQQENIANGLRRRNEREVLEGWVRQADCSSCMEARDRSGMAFLPCKHSYCGECIAGKLPTSFLIFGITKY